MHSVLPMSRKCAIVEIARKGKHTEERAMSVTTDTRTEQTITVKELVVGDEIVYLDGTQVITHIDKWIDLDFRLMFDIYVEGVKTPTYQGGRAPVTVLR